LYGLVAVHILPPNSFAATDKFTHYSVHVTLHYAGIRPDILLDKTLTYSGTATGENWPGSKRAQ